MNNAGPYLFCGLVCVWPLLWAVIAVLLYRRWLAEGWRGLLPGRRQ